MKLGVSSYSFSQLVGKGVLSQLDVIPKAKEMGFDVIEFSTLSLPKGETPLSFAPRVREACDKAGLPIANYTIGADFLNGSNGDCKAEAARLNDELRVAQILHRVRGHGGSDQGHRRRLREPEAVCGRRGLSRTAHHTLRRNRRTFDR